MPRPPARPKAAPAAAAAAALPPPSLRRSCPSPPRHARRLVPEWQVLTSMEELEGGLRALSLERDLSGVMDSPLGRRGARRSLRSEPFFIGVAGGTASGELRRLVAVCSRA